MSAIINIIQNLVPEAVKYSGLVRLLVKQEGSSSRGPVRHRPPRSLDQAYDIICSLSGVCEAKKGEMHAAFLNYVAKYGDDLALRHLAGSEDMIKAALNCMWAHDQDEMFDKRTFLTDIRKVIREEHSLSAYAHCDSYSSPYSMKPRGRITDSV